MTAISKTGVNVSYKYDAYGRRVEKYDSNTSTRRIYFYDTGRRLLAEYQNPVNGSNPTLRIEYFKGQIGEYIDRTGSVRYSTATAGWRHYYPFGEEVTGTAGDTYKFAELYRDADTGLDYAQHRYYSGSTGRFQSSDPLSAKTPNPCSFGRFSVLELNPNGLPLGAPQTLNRFSYSGNDPVNYKDPSGLIKRSVDPDDPPDNCGGGAGEPEPETDPLGCNFTGFTVGPRTTRGFLYGYYQNVDMVAIATGGNGSYSWSNVQLTSFDGTVTFSDHTRSVAEFPEPRDEFLPQKPMGATLGFRDNPGIKFWPEPIAFDFYFRATLTATVTSGDGQRASCSISWTVHFIKKKGEADWTTTVKFRSHNP
jgi:RHS repeat-associated protein